MTGRDGSKRVGSDDRPAGSSGTGDRDRVTALSLMRMALALLDRAGEMHGATRRQHAIDTVLDVPPGAPDEAEIDRLLGAERPG